MIRKLSGSVRSVFLSITVLHVLDVFPPPVILQSNWHSCADLDATWAYLFIWISLCREISKTCRAMLLEDQVLNNTVLDHAAYILYFSVCSGEEPVLLHPSLCSPSLIAIGYLPKPVRQRKSIMWHLEVISNLWSAAGCFILCISAK